MRATRTGLGRRGLLLGALLVGACRRESSDDGTAPQARSLPPLLLRDDTPDLLLTYLDERGDHHTAQRVDEIPAGSRNPVRVVVTTRDEGATTSLLYVADLSQKRPDGSYPVVSMTRPQWEALASQRRAPTPTAVASGVPAPLPPPPSGRARVVLYGASWCGPCHDAQSFLKARGVVFDYHDIEVETEAREEMLRKVERAGQRKGPIPVIDVGGRILVGYDPSALRAALKATLGDSAAL